MQITTKFSIGDIVHSIGTKHTPGPGEPCPMCDGAGSLTLANGKTFSCPRLQCNNGMVPSKHITTWVVRPPRHVVALTVVVGRANATSKGLTQAEHYSTVLYGGNTNYESGDDLFATQEEAERECGLRNMRGVNWKVPEEP